jgi:uncharacterized protein
MIEEEVFFPAGPLQIEGRYAEGRGDAGAVICHPHSQMGGSMWNNVVDALVAACRQQGLATLRFNFRGVGRSGGMYDNGRGEQEDIAGARDFLRTKGKTAVVFAGYSFGAWVGAKLLARTGAGEGGALFRDAVLVAPPLGMMRFDAPRLAGEVGLVISGDRDQFCPEEALRAFAAEIGCRAEVIAGADHFFMSKETNIISCLASYMEKRPVNKENNA